MVERGSLEDFKKFVDSNSLSACAEIRLIELDKTEEFSYYVRQYRIEMATQIKLLELGTEAMLNIYLRSNHGVKFPINAEIKLLRRNDLVLLAVFLRYTSFSSRAISWMMKHCDKRMVNAVLSLNR